MLRAEAVRLKSRLNGLRATKSACADWEGVMHQTRVAVFVHVTWGTWDRLPLLTGEVERAVHRALSDGCEELGAQVVAVGGVDDHVHLLVRLPAIISLAELMRRIKGASAHLVTHQIAPGEFFKWQGGYGAFSVSPRHLARVRDYIAHQRDHHAIGTLLPQLEPEYDLDAIQLDVR